MLHVKSAQCVAHDLHPGTLECVCWRQFNVRGAVRRLQKSRIAPFNAVIIIIIIIIATTTTTTTITTTTTTSTTTAAAAAAAVIIIIIIIIIIVINIIQIYAYVIIHCLSPIFERP